MSTDEEDELDAVEALVAQANAHGWADADEGDDDDMLAQALALSLAEAAGGASGAGNSVDEPSGPGRPDAPSSSSGSARKPSDGGLGRWNGPAMMCSSCVDECNEACDDCDEEFPWDFDDAEVGARPDASAPPARARAGRVAATEVDEDNDHDYVPSEADDEEELNSADEYSPVYAKAAQTASSTSGGAAAIAPAAAVAPAAGSGGGDVKDALGELDELQEELDWIRSTLAPTNASGWLDRPVLRRGRRSVQLHSDLMDAHFILPPEVQRATDSYWLAPGNLGKVLDATPLRAPSASDAADAGEGKALLRHRAAYMQRLMTALLLPAADNDLASASSS